MKAVEITIPPDKSISHRAIMLASISKGITRIKNLLMAEDIKRTIEAFRAMGVSICFAARSNNIVIVQGVGIHGLTKPSKPLYLGNSGTTMRILSGILAGQDFEVVLTGDESLCSRPMRRIVEPLREMGAEITPLDRDENEAYPPLRIRGGKLKSIKYKSKISSAQVKSCILLAGLYADGVTSVSEPEKSRDHTERMLKIFGSGLRVQGLRVSLKGPVKLKSPGVIKIPGDISSAAFFIVAGCILADIKIVIRDVGLNPTRTGILDILKKMDADITILMAKLTDEPMGNITIKSSRLRAVTISPEEVVRAIDEIPIIMVAACFAEGKTIIKGAGELRVKETDRIKSMVTNLKKMGADIRVQPAPEGECIIINGCSQLRSAKLSSFGDHRTAMSMLIAGLCANVKVSVSGLECINKSFPSFHEVLRKCNR